MIKLASLRLLRPTIFSVCVLATGGFATLGAAPLEVAQGVTLEIEEKTKPRPLRLHWLEADLKTPGVSFEVSGPNGEKPGEASAALPTQVALDHGWAAVMNGDAFTNLSGDQPMFYSTGLPVDLMGLAVQNGKTFSQPNPHYSYFYQTKAGKFGVGIGAPPRHLKHAVAGFGRIIEKGRVRPSKGGKLHPRSAIGYDAKRNRLIFLVVDGRQTGVSEGVTRRELAELMRQRGATEALNLDGGGSSQLAVVQNGKARIINRPVGLFNQPGTVRPVGNCVGIKAPPLN